MEEIKRELIKKHLEDWTGLKQSSIEHFAQSGKASGSFFTALKDMLDEYAEQLRIGAVSNSEVFEHYGKPFTSGRDLWDFLTAHYNFTPKT